MKRMLTAGDRHRLLVLLKADAERRASELREAGWEEDERGLWSLPGSEYAQQHLHDAHALAAGREA